MAVVELSVPEIHCDHCKASLESVVGEVSGVATVTVAISERSIAVGYDGQTETYASVVDAIEGQGYSVAADS